MSKKIVAPAYVAAMERAEADPAAARVWMCRVRRPHRKVPSAEDPPCGGPCRPRRRP
jgi:hypothetical protein